MWNINNLPWSILLNYYASFRNTDSFYQPTFSSPFCALNTVHWKANTGREWLATQMGIRPNFVVLADEPRMWRWLKHDLLVKISQKIL